jgi:molybdopterin synthase sulfur carrier subunit
MSEPAIPLRILYFAWLRERVGLSEETLIKPDDVGTLAELIAWLAIRDDRHAAAFAQSGVIRCALNQEFAPLNSPIAPGDEIAFFPPVTGG